MNRVDFRSWIRDFAIVGLLLIGQPGVSGELSGFRYIDYIRTDRLDLYSKPQGTSVGWVPYDGLGGKPVIQRESGYWFEIVIDGEFYWVKQSQVGVMSKLPGTEAPRSPKRLGGSRTIVNLY